MCKYIDAYKEVNMIINDAKFLKSAADKSGFMQFDKPLIAVCGRSNVGKSSFINMISNRKKLARTSKDPGRTRLVNYFDMGEFALADLPGYGFAQVSKNEKLKWARTIEDFFAYKEHVSHAFLLLDIRREPNEDDIMFINYLNHYIIPFTVICTKTDKLSKTRVKPAVKKIADSLTLGVGNVLAVSNDSGFGKDSVYSRLDEIVAAYAMTANDDIGDDEQTGDGENE